MSEFKEAWFVWDGKGVAPSQSDLVGVITNGFHWRNNQAYPPEHFDLPLLYTTGQKRRRVECKACHGIGSPVTEHPEGGLKVCFDDKCGFCKGTGKAWEYKQGVE